MKKYKKKVFICIIIFLSFFIIKDKNAVKAEEEMRGVWIASVYNIDWPQNAAYNPNGQKDEFIKLVDNLKSTGINTIIIQVRPESDALYKSNINPWSKYLTGVEGKDPGYDPLKFIIDESHKRGIKVHAWLNPYRASVKSDKSGSIATNPINLHPDWTIKYNNKWYYDPGNPQVTTYIVNTVNEIVKNYDIDGIQFDDYFYPDANFPDSETFKKYGSSNIGDWRRSNINNMITQVNKSIKSIKPGVVFGISPSGIWRNYSSDASGSNTNGSESYSVQHADSKYWIQNNLIDYIAPQVYWEIGNTRADYATLVEWWSNQVKSSRVKLYIGQGIYKHGQVEENGENVASQIKQQIELNRKYPEISGSMYFSSSDIINNSQVIADLKSLYSNPIEKRISGVDSVDMAINISREGWRDSSSRTAILINSSDQSLAGPITSPLASLNKCPVLTVDKGIISDSTVNELKRLGVNKLILIGKDQYFPPDQLDKVKLALPNIVYDKIYANDVYVLSNKIAQRIKASKTVDSIYIVGENGVEDAIAISSKAAKEINPILVTKPYSLNKVNVLFVKSANTKNIYFLGGNLSIKDSNIKKTGRLLSTDLSTNRIGGANAVETNINIIKKFYPNLSYKNTFVIRHASSTMPYTLGSLPQALDSPIIISTDTVSPSQTVMLNPRDSDVLYRIGDDINSSVYTQINSLLN